MGRRVAAANLSNSELEPRSVTIHVITSTTYVVYMIALEPSTAYMPLSIATPTLSLRERLRIQVEAVQRRLSEIVVVVRKDGDLVTEGEFPEVSHNTWTQVPTLLRRGDHYAQHVG